MKISIIGSGNVGALTAMRLAESRLGNVVLIDVIKGIAIGKALDMEDAQALVKNNYSVNASDDISLIKDSNIVVITAGLARKPGMTREELLLKNSSILKELSLKIRELAPKSIVIVVTNPLDLMTYLVLKTTGFKHNKIIGMGVSLDTSRFANIISKELNINVSDIKAIVIGSHGESMLPLPRHSYIKDANLKDMLDTQKQEYLLKKTINRGAEIVSNLGTGSAFFAPSAAIAEIVNAICKDQNAIIPACAYLNGEYGIKDISIGVPCCIGKDGIEKIVELKLDQEEKEKLNKSAESIRQLTKNLPI